MVGLNRHHGPTGASKFGLNDWATRPEFRELCPLQGARPRKAQPPSSPLPLQATCGSHRFSHKGRRQLARSAAPPQGTALTPSGLRSLSAFRAATSAPLSRRSPLATVARRARSPLATVARRAQAESGTTLTPSDLTPSRPAPPRVLPPSLTAAGTSTAASSSSSDASSRVRGGPRRASSAPLHAPPPRLPLPANAAVNTNAQSCRRTSRRGLPCWYEQLVGHRTARDVFIFRRLTRFMMFAGFRLSAETAGNGSGEITCHPHVRIPPLVRQQRDDCETVARPAPRQRPGKDGAVVSPPRSPNLISGGDALPVPSPAPLRAAGRAYTRQPTPRLTRVPARSRPQSLQRLQHRHRFGNLCARGPAPYLRRAPGPPPAAASDGTTQ